MILKQLFDHATWTYTYLLGDPESGQALLIDPVAEQADRDLALLEELGLRLVFTLETHVHADHVTASGVLRERTGSRSVVSSKAGVPCIDLAVEHGDVLTLGSLELEVLHTPGHTDGCVSYVLRGETPMVFTGDALLIRGCGRTDFQAGDAEVLFSSVRERLFTLADHTLVYPGHDYRGHTVSSIAEERAHNPRLRDGTSLAQFIDIMSNLRLANPKHMDVAVPANMACGQPPEQGRDGHKADNGQQPGESEATPAPQPAFSSVSPRQARSLAGMEIIDVRQADEFDGELGHIEGARLVPLDTLPAASASWPLEAPLLLVCRSGARSSRACELLVQRGFQNVTNLEGGMLAWNQESPAASCG